MTLRNVSLTEENETALVHEGALPPLIELLQHTDDHIAEQALVTLRNMSVNVDNGTLYLLYYYRSTNTDSDSPQHVGQRRQQYTLY